MLGSNLPRDNPVKAHQDGEWGTERLSLLCPNAKHRMVDLAMPQKTRSQPHMGQNYRNQADATTAPGKQLFMQQLLRFGFPVVHLE